MILVCSNRRLNKPACAGHGSEALLQQLKQALAGYGDRVQVEATCCMGFCDKGPNIRVAPAGNFYVGFDMQQLEQLKNELDEKLKQ